MHSSVRPGIDNVFLWQFVTTERGASEKLAGGPERVRYE
jgi:hypothetical protein